MTRRRGARADSSPAPSVGSGVSITLLIAAGTAGFLVLASPPASLEFRSTAEERLMVFKTNEERAMRGLSPLALSAEASAVARAYSVRMFETKRVQHVDAQGRGPGERVSQAGIRASAFAENIAYHRSPPEAHTAFMGSPPHRANILDPVYREMGVGVFTDPKNDIYVTELFLTPLAMPRGGEDAVSLFRRKVEELRRTLGLFPLAWDDALAAAMRESGKARPPHSRETTPVPSNLRGMLAAAAMFSGEDIEIPPSMASLVGDARFTHFGGDVEVEKHENQVFSYRVDVILYKKK